VHKPVTPRGFTLIELCLGLVITSLVMGAMAAFSLAMSTAWKSAESSQSISLLANQTVVRLQNEIRQSKMIGAVRAGTSAGTSSNAAVLLWKADTSGDGYIQGNEVSLIEHDVASHTLRLYYSGQADAAGTWSYGSTFTASATLNNFKTNRNYKVLARNVYGAVFQSTGTTGTSQSPTLHFALKFMVNDTQANSSQRVAGGMEKLMVQYGSASLRVPLTQPAN
jgi:type II secretory pathway component PulJ